MTVEAPCSDWEASPPHSAPSPCGGSVLSFWLLLRLPSTHSLRAPGGTDFPRGQAFSLFLRDFEGPGE